MLERIAPRHDIWGTDAETVRPSMHASELLPLVRGLTVETDVWHTPTSYPGGDPMGRETAEKFTGLWGFQVPQTKGLSAVEMIAAAHGDHIDMLYSAGGNFLETLPEPQFVQEALAKVPLRIHQDIVLSSQMFVEPADEVILLPAQTRYEQRGGGTETSTERYILYSPEIPGRRIGESRAEWEILMELAERTYPERKAQIHFEDVQAIREDIARAVPLYHGIERLKSRGDAVQWGGPLLCRNGEFQTPEGKATFTPLSPPNSEIPGDRFQMSTRRGKQFNSMVQAHYDPLTGATRDQVFLNPEDARSIGVQEGQWVLLRSERGELRGRVKLMPIQPRNVQTFWPEGNVLLERDKTDPLCGIPDYNTQVQVIPLLAGI